MLDGINFDFNIGKIKMAIHSQKQSQLLSTLYTNKQYYLNS